MKFFVWDRERIWRNGRYTPTKNSQDYSSPPPPPPAPELSTWLFCFITINSNYGNITSIKPLIKMTAFSRFEPRRTESIVRRLKSENISPGLEMCVSRDLVKLRKRPTVLKRKKAGTEGRQLPDNFTRACTLGASLYIGFRYADGPNRLHFLCKIFLQSKFNRQKHYFFIAQTAQRTAKTTD